MPEGAALGSQLFRSCVKGSRGGGVGGWEASPRKKASRVGTEMELAVRRASSCTWSVGRQGAMGWWREGEAVLS